MRIPARVENAGGAVLVFWAALAILALHAATDSFIAPEPGTGPLDHLLRGSVSLASLGLGPERPAQQRPPTEHLEELASDRESGDPFGPIASGQVDVRRPPQC